MLHRALLLCALVVSAPAAAAETDYALSCRREILDAVRAKARPAATPLDARIHYTGTTSTRRERDGGETRYENLEITIGGRRLKGGYVVGSSYDSSTTFDEGFARTGEGSTTWAFSRGFGAFTLSHGGRQYVCDRR